MENIDYNSVKRKIENEQCETHNQHPKFEKMDSKINISTCCEDFHLKMQEKAKIIMTKETTLTIENMLKEIFR